MSTLSHRLLRTMIPEVNNSRGTRIPRRPYLGNSEGLGRITCLLDNGSACDGFRSSWERELGLESSTFGDSHGALTARFVQYRSVYNLVLDAIVLVGICNNTGYCSKPFSSFTSHTST